MSGEEKCYWPDVGNIQNMAETKVEPSENWKLYKCTIICQASKYGIFGMVDISFVRSLTRFIHVLLL